MSGEDWNKLIVMTAEEFDKFFETFKNEFENSEFYMKVINAQISLSTDTKPYTNNKDLILASLYLESYIHEIIEEFVTQFCLNHNLDIHIFWKKFSPLDQVYKILNNDPELKTLLEL